MRPNSIQQAAYLVGLRTTCVDKALARGVPAVQLCSDSTDCCSGAFTGTKRMFGRATASQIASVALMPGVDHRTPGDDAAVANSRTVEHPEPILNHRETERDPYTSAAPASTFNVRASAKRRSERQLRYGNLTEDSAGSSSSSETIARSTERQVALAK